MSTVPAVETEIETTEAEVAAEDTFYPVDAATEPVATTDDTATVGDTPAAATEKTTTVDTTEKPATEAKSVETKTETADELALKAKTGKRFQELLDRTKQLEAELSLARQPKSDDVALKAPVAPDPDTFTGTWDELKAAQAKYAKDLVAFEIAKHDKDTTERAQHARIKEYHEGLTKVWNTRAAKTIERDADFRKVVQESDTSAIKAELLEGINATANEFFTESEVGPDLLLHYAKNPAERAKLYAMGVRECSRELTRMEDQIVESLKPAPKVTKAPRPAADVTGGSAGLPKEKSFEDTFYD